MSSEENQPSLSKDLSLSGEVKVCGLTTPQG